MSKGPRSLKELEKTLYLQKIFPNLGQGFSNGLTYRSLAKNIKNYEEKDHGFDTYSINTVIKYIKWALHGFEYNGTHYVGLEEDTIDSQIHRRKREISMRNSGFLQSQEVWVKGEEEFIKKLYSQGVPPKEIWQRYSEEESFTNRSYNAIESRIYFLKKKKR